MEKIRTEDDKDTVPQVHVKVEFGGGMEVLFSNVRSHSLTLPSSYTFLPTDKSPAKSASKQKPTDIRFLIAWLKENLLQDKKRPDLFVQGDSVRPGILVLINDSDWELEGELGYEIQDGDEIVFISTLHGG